jgi:zinc protease
MKRLLVATMCLTACGGAPHPKTEESRAKMLEEMNREGAPIKLADEFRYNDALAVEKYVLDNGLTVLFLEDHGSPVFSYQTWFRVGSRHEQEGKTGIAHLFEHLMFKETSNTPEGVFDRTLEGIGARVNAATWLDWTFYYEDVPAGNLETVIKLEADRMENMILNDKQLEAEREVVINERRQRVDNDPSGKLSEVLWSLAFDVSPYKHPTIGWMKDIEGLSLVDCTQFYGTYYAPNNAVLVVVGDVDRREMLRMVRQYYGHLKAQEVPKPEEVQEPSQVQPRKQEVRLAIGSERVLLGYKAPAVTDAKAAALEILNEVLFEGDSSRLQRALVTDGEIATGVSAFVPPFRFPGLYEISVDLRPGHTGEEAEEVVLGEFAKVIEKGITDAELSKAQNKLETRFYRQLETNNQKAHGLGFWEVTAEDYRMLFTIADRYRLITVDDVQAIAREVLRPESRTVVFGRSLGEEAPEEE